MRWLDGLTDAMDMNMGTLQQMVTEAMKSKAIASWQESYDRPRYYVEKWRHYSADKSPYSQGCGVCCDHVRFWELDHKEVGAPKNWCLRTMVLEKTPEGPLNSKIKPVNLKGNQPWILIGRTDAEVEAPVFWSSDAKSWLIAMSLVLGKIEGRRRRGQQSMRWLDDITNAWTWTWASSRRWWGTRRLDVMQSMGSQRVAQYWVTEQQ